MDKLLKIGIVGCGAIGTSLARIIVKDFSNRAKLIALYDIDKAKSVKLASLISGVGELAVRNLDGLINKSDLVIEAASAKCSGDIAREVLSKGRNIMIMSVGGILDNFRELYNLAKKHNAKVYIPSGAIAGIDALKALACSRINSVTLTTKKPPRAFSGVPYVVKKKINLDNLKKETVIFKGNVYSAIKSFPQNINVAATLSLAGIGPARTRVRIIASPEITKNIHEIKIKSEAGSVVTCTQNIIHPHNPKTSYLAVLSAVATLKQVLDPVRVGA
jgi:aspartate dehydrogenase